MVEKRVLLSWERVLEFLYLFSSLPLISIVIDGSEPLFSQLLHENFTISFVKLGLKSVIQGLHPRQFEDRLVVSKSIEVKEGGA